MSRPMVTRYIEAMEDWLQTRLLYRTTRKISLTISGESCLKEVESWLDQAQGLTSLTASSAELSGTIKIAVCMSFGFSQLMPALKDFMQIHPRVNIDIDLQDSVSDLTEQRIDLAIRIASDPDPSLIEKLPGRYSDLWDLFKTVKHSYDEEAYEVLLADDELREEFYGRLSEFGKTLGIAHSLPKIF